MSQLAEEIYALLLKIPAGRVTTYRALAEAAGTRAYRAVGQILKRNPDAPRIPCHRVIRSDGTIGGFGGQTAGPEITKKKKLLAQEGVEFVNGRLKDSSQLITDLR